MRDDRGAGLVGGTDRDPAHRAVADVVADLEAEGVAVAGQEASGSSCGRKLAGTLMSMSVRLVAAAWPALLDS
jgi:hypothetical protein